MCQYKPAKVMTRLFLSIFAVVTSSLLLNTQTQAQPSNYPGQGNDDYQSSQSTANPNAPGSKSESGWTQGFAPIGSMGHHDIKASELTGFIVSGNSGDPVGTISDCIVNPSSGRLEFAIISLNILGPPASAISNSPGAAPPRAKQVAVPWILLRPSALPGSSSANATTTRSFTFIGDSAKLASAPTFDANTDLSQPSWRRNVFSYFGMTPGSASGGAESPGAQGSGSSVNSKNPPGTPHTP